MSDREDFLFKLCICLAVIFALVCIAVLVNSCCSSSRIEISKEVFMTDNTVAKLYGFGSSEHKDAFLASGDYVETPTLSAIFEDIGTGLKNAWYNLTGQQHKTDLYKYEEELENTKNQRLAADLEAAGLSKYGMTGTAPTNSMHSSETSGLQKIAAMIDMRKAMAEIDNVEADTGVKGEQARDIASGIEYREKNYQLDAARTQSEIDRNEVLNELTKNQSQETAENTLSIISARTRAEAEHVYKLIKMNVENQLAYKDLNTYDERHEAEMAVKRTSAYLNNQKAESEIKQREYIDKQMEEAAARIAHYAAQDQHLSYEDELLLADYAYRQLQYEVLLYDYNYSYVQGLRTGDAPSRVGGVNLSQFADQLTHLFAFHPGGDTLWQGLPATGGGGGSAW